MTLDLGTSLYRAVKEIESLRRENELLRAKVETFELCAALFHAPQVRSDGYGDDVVWKLRRHLEDIEKASTDKESIQGDQHEDR